MTTHSLLRNRFSSKRVFSDIMPDEVSSGKNDSHGAPLPKRMCPSTSHFLFNNKDDERNDPKVISAASSINDFHQTDSGFSRARCAEIDFKNAVFGQTIVQKKAKKRHTEDTQEQEQHEYWQEIAPDRRQNLVRVTHRQHEGPLRRMSVWDGIIGALGRHYDLLSSGDIAVGETTGRHHPVDAAMPLSLPASSAAEQNPEHFMTQLHSKSVETSEIVPDPLSYGIASPVTPVKSLKNDKDFVAYEASPTNNLCTSVITIDENEEKDDMSDQSVQNKVHHFTNGMNHEFTGEHNVVSMDLPLTFSAPENRVDEEIEASAAGRISYQGTGQTVMTMSDSYDALIMYSDNCNDTLSLSV